MTTVTQGGEVEGLVERLRGACDRAGKPSGVHMIDGQRMIAKAMAEHLEDEDAQCIAQVADCMAHCIENEALLFECLRTEALTAIDALQSQATELATLKQQLAEAVEHINEQATFAESRIQDGKDMGASVWRIALEDVARENRALTQKDGAQ